MLKNIDFQAILGNELVCGIFATAFIKHWQNTTSVNEREKAMQQVRYKRQ
jgi:hypothetical protein